MTDTPEPQGTRQEWYGLSHLREIIDSRTIGGGDIAVLEDAYIALSSSPREPQKDETHAAQPHPETLRAYVQHKPDCRSRSLRDFCRQHGGDGGINGCPACQGMAPSRSCTCGLNEALEALSYACQAADCRDCDSDYCECRCHKHAAQTEALRALSQQWRRCAERSRTLGFHKEALAQDGCADQLDALSASPAPHTERTE